MILDSIKEQFKKKGFWKTIEFYFCRVMSKAALKVVGTYAANHGKLHRNYIVFKNRTMQDMTRQSIREGENYEMDRGN